MKPSSPDSGRAEPGRTSTKTASGATASAISRHPATTIRQPLPYARGSERSRGRFRSRKCFLNSVKLTPRPKPGHSGSYRSDFLHGVLAVRQFVGHGVQQGGVAYRTAASMGRHFGAVSFRQVGALTKLTLWISKPVILMRPRGSAATAGCPALPQGPP